MALCPFAVQKPVTSHGGPMSAHLGVVFHVTAGEGDPYNEFVNPANQVSSHFGILNGQGGTEDGALEQYVDTDNESWAQMAGNATYISVETEGEPTEALTDAQLATFAKLYAWIHETHGVPFVITDTPGDPGFITHGDGGAAWGNHPGCPGSLRAAQRQAILDAANPPPQPTTLPPEVLMASPLFASNPSPGTAITEVDYFDTNGHWIQGSWDATNGWVIYDHVAGTYLKSFPAASTT